MFQPATRWLLCLFWLGASVQAHAATLCVPDLQGQSLSLSVSQLRKLEPQCHKNAAFLFNFGQVLNQAGLYDQAIDQLEAALMHRPGHWPTQLEYAIALEGVGDKLSALSLIRDLTENPEVDSAIRQQLQALQDRPTSAPVAERRGRFGIVAGYDNNLLSSTYNSQFALTTPDGLLQVELDQDQRPRAGLFVRSDLAYDGVFASSEAATWRYSLLAAYRNNPGAKSANYGQLGALVERSANNQPGPYVLGQHQVLTRSGSTVLQQTQLGTGYDFPLHLTGDCLQRLGVDLQRISYPTSTVLNGRYIGLSTTTSCPTSGLQAQLRVGQDRPLDSAKPGGSQQQISLRVSKRTQLADAALTLEAEATHQQDHSGYSVLLASNARRQVSRVILRAEYRWSLGGISPYVALEATEQRSNLSLFEFRNQSVMLGFSSRW